MRNASEVKKEIKDLGKISLWGVGKELKELPSLIDTDEKIVGLLRVFSSATIVLLCATNKRLLILDRHTFYGRDHKEVSYLQISCVDYNTRLFFGKITIDEQSEKNVFDWAYKSNLRKFVNVLGDKISEYREKSISHDTNHGGIAAEIEKMWILVQKGALTQEEFEARKKRLLEK